MKVCKKCGKEIEDKASVCMHCGVKLKKPVFKKWWFWVVIVVIAIAIIGGSGGNDSNTTTTKEPENVKQEQTINYEAVDLKTMIDELSNNALKAEKTYNNKYIEITGKISNFDSDGGYISVKPTNTDEWFFESVMCYIKNDAQTEFLLNKNVDDIVTIKGKIKSVGEVLGYSINIDEIK